MDHIHVTVAAIIKRNNHYLLVKEQASSGEIVFNQPAGHVELKETLVNAVIREVKEETNLTFTPTSLIGTYLLSPAANGKTYLRFCFVGDVPDTEHPSPLDPDIIENCWFTKEQIIQMKPQQLRSALVLKCLNDFLQGKRLPLDSLSGFHNEDQLGVDCYESLKRHRDE